MTNDNNDTPRFHGTDRQFRFAEAEQRRRRHYLHAAIVIGVGLTILGPLVFADRALGEILPYFAPPLFATFSIIAFRRWRESFSIVTLTASGVSRHSKGLNPVHIDWEDIRQVTSDDRGARLRLHSNTTSKVLSIPYAMGQFEQLRRFILENVNPHALGSPLMTTFKLPRAAYLPEVFVLLLCMGPGLMIAERYGLLRIGLGIIALFLLFCIAWFASTTRTLRVHADNLSIDRGLKRVHLSWHAIADIEVINIENRSAQQAVVAIFTTDG